MYLMLQDPFLRDTWIYVQPLGIQSLAFHIVLLAQRNPNTPYDLHLNTDPIHTTVFDRYITLRSRECSDLPY